MAYNKPYKPQAASSNLPEKKFSTGAIRATIWKNMAKNQQGQDIEYRTISIDRRYKDKDGNWQSTNSLRVNDLPKLALVANEAYRYLILKDMEGNASDEAHVDTEEIVM